MSYDDFKLHGILKQMLTRIHEYLLLTLKLNQ